MLKGVRIGGVGKTLTFLDKLVIPIIENTPDEEDLTDSMAQVHHHPQCVVELVLTTLNPVAYRPWRTTRTRLPFSVCFGLWL